MITIKPGGRERERQRKKNEKNRQRDALVKKLLTLTGVGARESKTRNQHKVKLATDGLLDGTRGGAAHARERGRGGL